MSPPLRQECVDALATVQGDMRLALDLLTQVLETEHEALGKGDIEALDHAGARKQALMQQLEQLDAERRLLLQPEPPARATPDPMWTAIEQSLRHCHQLNQRNGGIVSQRLHWVRQALALLTGADGSNGLYDRSGELHASPRSRPLAAA
jgi:flagella synthesis protein FlgN